MPKEEIELPIIPEELEGIAKVTGIIPVSKTRFIVVRRKKWGPEGRKEKEYVDVRMSNTYFQKTGSQGWTRQGVMIPLSVAIKVEKAIAEARLSPLPVKEE